MTCRELIDFLMDYLDGDLPEGQASAFEEHLDICPACVDYIDGYKKTIELGQAVCAEEDEALPTNIPDDLIQAILAARRANG